MGRITRIRLYSEGVFASGAALSLPPDQAHYLHSVMRLAPGDVIEVLNGTSGGWHAQIETLGKKQAALRLRAQIRPVLPPPDLWLLFAPVKKARTDFIVEKATEMGAAEIHPVLTAYTNAERVRAERLQKIAQEAIEQCGGTVLPHVAEAQKLCAWLADWPQDRGLIFCDETRAGAGVSLEAAQGAAYHKWAILIGPEGGFAPEEQRAIASLPQAVPLSLGPRILRADTAAVAALTAFQLSFGDWRKEVAPRACE